MNTLPQFREQRGIALCAVVITSILANLFARQALRLSFPKFAALIDATATRHRVHSRKAVSLVCRPARTRVFFLSAATQEMRRCHVTLGLRCAQPTAGARKMVKWGRGITRLRTRTPRTPPHTISGRNSHVRAARLIVMMMTSVLLLRHRRRNLNRTPISLGAEREEAGRETGMHAVTA